MDLLVAACVLITPIMLLTFVVYCIEKGEDQWRKVRIPVRIDEFKEIHRDRRN